MSKLKGNMGIGHVRYPTAGSDSVAEAQPFYTNSPFGISLSHNGNINNTDEIISGLLEYDYRRINTSSDSEALMNLFAAELQRSVSGKSDDNGQLSDDDVFRAIERTMMRLEGSYSVVSMITGWGIVAFRDPNGIRPLFLGSNSSSNFVERIVASESVACKALGFIPERDVRPGEAIIIRTDGSINSRICHPKPNSLLVFSNKYILQDQTQ